MRKSIRQKITRRVISSRFLSQWVVLVIDTFVSVVCTAIACLLAKYLGNGPAISFYSALVITALSAVVSVFCFFVFKTYRHVIRHSTLKDLWRVGAVAVMKVAIMSVVLVFKGSATGHQLFLGGAFDMLFTAIGLTAVRTAMIMGYHIVMARISRDGKKRILIYGSGENSVALETRLRDSTRYNVEGFYVFGDNYKRYRMSGRPMYYFRNEADFKYITDKYGIDGILFPSYDSARKEKDRLIRYCEAKHVSTLISPPVGEFDEDNLLKTAIREIKIEDLLGRDEIEINMTHISSSFKGKSVLVTGAAGSIGSELCRQLAGLGIGLLVMYDNAETPLHNIRLELEDSFPECKFVAHIGDVRAKLRTDRIFDKYRPQVVFHAAAYKHVPLMEENPCEAVQVNTQGTRNIADLAVKYEVERMIMISTDKAVNPTNVMGASKRLAEMYVQSLGCAIERGSVEGKTKFITTRFGNVLGSNGSVIPRFREQIERGGPLTVTHPEITRFFMTIPEACRLVMEAATMSNGNEIFVFEMGDPVRIYDLAVRMIELAGYRPESDIEIKYTGLRPGEKLYEEVLCDKENTLPTFHEKIKIAKVRECCYGELDGVFGELDRFSEAMEIEKTIRLMKLTVPEYVSNNSAFNCIDIEIGIPVERGDPVG
jgi:FlaA1/EpsC-like NDP-sugar epimerase